MTDNDNEIWDHVVKTVKPLKKRNTVKTTVKPRLPIIKERTTPFAIAATKKTPSPPPLRTVKQLKRQKIPIQAQLDLHGFTIAQAHKKLIAFITQSVQRDLRCVEIITGRGNPEKGTGQLRRHVPIWLNEDQNMSSHIVHCTDNPASRGGSLLVLLRRNKTKS